MIDWNFIGELEGGTLNGEVPDAENSHSGVTFQGGIDVANMGPEIWNALPDDLRLKLQPYRWWKGIAAAHYLETHPISITAEERETLQELCAGETLNLLRTNYLRDAKIAFDSIPDACQTVAASISFQYGNMSIRTPNFWRALCEKDWVLCYKDLMSFHDRYPSRRKREAEYLRQNLGLEGV